jgi:hypothetical protein
MQGQQRAAGLSRAGGDGTVFMFLAYGEIGVRGKRG